MQEIIAEYISYGGILIMKKLRKWTALFCAGVIAVCSLAGCGGESGEINATGKDEEHGGLEAAAEKICREIKCKKLDLC